MAASVGGVARAASPGAPADSAATVTVVSDPSPTAIAGPLAAAAPSGAAAPVGSAAADDEAVDAGEAVDVGSPPVPAHRPLVTVATTLPPMTVDPWTLFPGATIPADVTSALPDAASASAGAVALVGAPMPVGAAPASEPIAGESAPAAATAARPATLPATR